MDKLPPRLEDVRLNKAESTPHVLEGHHGDVWFISPKVSVCLFIGFLPQAP